MLLVIDNYYKEENASKAKQIVKALRKCGNYQVKVRKYNQLGRDVGTDVDALILSGSAAHPWKKAHLEMYREELRLIREQHLPLLGLCFGHQLIGKAFGAHARSLDSPINGFEPVEIIRPDEIFTTWTQGSTLQLCESHKDAIALPSAFIHLARSASCTNEAMKHPTRPIYSTQAHLERSTEAHSAGLKIIQNFLQLLS